MGIQDDIRVEEGAVDTALRQHSSKSSLSLQSRAVESDHVLVVTIEDYGVGVSEEMRETLFQPFRQAQRMAGGTGDIILHPTTTFIVSLPSYSPLTNTILSPPSANLKDLGCLVC